MTFLDGSTTLGIVSLINGTATFSTSALAASAHSIKAVYAGDGVYAGSSSSALTQEVVDLTVTPSTTSFAVASGSSGTVTFTATPTPGTGYAPSVQMTCSVSPAEAGCAMNPSTFTANGATTSTLTLTATKPGVQQHMIVSTALFLGMFFSVAGICVPRNKRTSHSLRWIGVCMLIASILALSACGGGSNSNSPKGAYTVTVTATTSGAIIITKPTTLALQVQ
jgi:hypothetical protein